MHGANHARRTAAAAAEGTACGCSLQTLMRSATGIPRCRARRMLQWRPPAGTADCWGRAMRQMDSTVACLLYMYRVEMAGSLNNDSEDTP